jgi:hypothetical protein
MPKTTLANTAVPVSLPPLPPPPGMMWRLGKLGKVQGGDAFYILYISRTNLIFPFTRSFFLLIVIPINYYIMVLISFFQ